MDILRFLLFSGNASKPQAIETSEHIYNAWASSKGRTVPVEKLRLCKGTHATHGDENTRAMRKNQRETAGPSAWSPVVR